MGKKIITLQKKKSKITEMQNIVKMMKEMKIDTCTIVRQT